MESSQPTQDGRRPALTMAQVPTRLTRLLQSSTTLQKSGRALRRHVWLWPIVAALILALTGWWVRHSVDAAMREGRIDDLTTILDATVDALQSWMENQRIIAHLVASDDHVVELAAQLASIPEEKGEHTRALLLSPARADLRDRLEGPLKTGRFVGFFLVSRDGVILTADQDPPIGKKLHSERVEFFQKVLRDGPSISKPYLSELSLIDENGELRAFQPTMFAAAPVIDSSGKTLGVIGLRIRPHDQFTRILAVAQSGYTGETYAFDSSALMLSTSRFEDQLREIRLLADQPHVGSILTVKLRDPGGDMTRGFRPAKPSELPLTRMAYAATQGQSGFDADGYRDYRGVPVVGAWKWLEKEGFGVATEVDAEEAFRPLYLLHRAFMLLIVLLVLASLGILAAMLFIAKQQQAIQDVTMTAKRLGQYTLEEKIGSGGMGTVYRARHAMLRRPTAIKLLNPSSSSEAAVARFEREVQFTSTLSHPNTVAIYDFGRTDDGIFYYAMEYLEGINLEDFVSRHGAMPEARIAFLLKQACGSLAEAHGAGLVHRDIKPGNIFLTVRGGLHDFVKVLDFGLVRTVDDANEARLTATNVVTGTPLYLSPEAARRSEQVDARSDVYALGAVGYFLLTGTPVFKGASVVEICMKQIHEPPEPPSLRLGRPVNPDLEGLLLRCLSKSPADRPANAGELLALLEVCHFRGEWSEYDARTWWREQRESAALDQAKETLPPTTSASLIAEQATLPDIPAL